jgi:ribosomal protein L18E
MPKRVQEPTQETPETKAMRASINAVYQKYGTDLTAFYRDIQESLAKSQSKAADVQLKKIER